MKLKIGSTELDNTINDLDDKSCSLIMYFTKMDVLTHLIWATSIFCTVTSASFIWAVLKK